MGKVTGYPLGTIVVLSLFIIFFSNDMDAGAKESTMKIFSGK